MNNENLILFNNRPTEEHRELSKKGAKKSNEVQKQQKEEEKEISNFISIVQRLLCLEAKPENFKRILRQIGAKDNNLFAVLVASVLRRGIVKGDADLLFKIIELLEGENNQGDTGKNSSFNKLIEAIKYARETKQETE